MRTKYYGHEIGSYGKECGYVDYMSFASSFNHVLANDLYYTLCRNDHESIVYDGVNEDEVIRLEDEINRLEDQINELESEEMAHGDKQCVIDSLYKEMGMLQRDLDELYEPDEIYQWYVVDEWAVTHQLKEAHEVVVYFEDADVYMWGVTHYGTSWDYVLTNIKLDEEA